MSKLLVVTGATGQQGSSVLTWFKQHEPTYKLRGLARDPSSTKARQLAEQGIEIVKADLDDVDSLKATFKGATAIWAYTAFGTIVRSPEVLQKWQSEPATPIGVFAYDVEVQQGRNIADAAAQVATLDRLIWSTLSDIGKRSGGKMTGAYHFDAKAHVLEYMHEAPGLQGKVSAIMMGAFGDNFLKMPGMYGFKKINEGQYIVSAPLPQGFEWPWVDVERDTGAFVHALILAPAGIHLAGVSESMPLQQWLDIFGARNGVSAKHAPVSAKEYIGEDPIGLQKMFLTLSDWLGENGYIDEDFITPDQLEAKGYSVPRTSVVETIKLIDWSGIL